MPGMNCVLRGEIHENLAVAGILASGCCLPPSWRHKLEAGGGRRGPCVEAAAGTTGASGGGGGGILLALTSATGMASTWEGPALACWLPPGLRCETNVKV